MEEFGVSFADQGHDAREYGDAHIPGRCVERLGLAQVEEGLCHDQVGAGLDLPFQPPDPSFQVGSVGIEGRRHGEAGLAVQGPAREAHALVHLLDQPDQFEGGDVVDIAGAGLIAEFDGIARDGEDVVDAQGVQAEHLGLQAGQVPVPAGDVQERPDPRLLLDDLAHGHVADPRDGEGIVGHGEGVRARRLQGPGAPYDGGVVQVPGRV